MNEKALAAAVARLHGQFTGDRNAEIKSSLPTEPITRTTDDISVSVDVPDLPRPTIAELMAICADLDLSRMYQNVEVPYGLADYPLRKEQEVDPETAALYDHIRDFVRAAGIKLPIVIIPRAPGVINDPTYKELTAESTVECPTTHFSTVTWTDLANGQPKVFPPSEPGIALHDYAVAADIMLNLGTAKPDVKHYTVLTLKDRKPPEHSAVIYGGIRVDEIWPVEGQFTNPHDVSELDRQLASAEVDRSVHMVAGGVNDNVRLTYRMDQPIVMRSDNPVSLNLRDHTHPTADKISATSAVADTIKHNKPVGSLKDRVNAKDPLYMDVRLRSRHERQPILQVVTHAMEHIPLQVYLLSISDCPLLCDYMRTLTHNLWLDEHQSLRVAVPDGVSCDFNKRPRFLIGQPLDPIYPIGMSSDTVRLLNILVTTRCMPVIMGVSLNHPIQLTHTVVGVEQYMRRLANACLTELTFMPKRISIIRVLDKLTRGLFTVRLSDIRTPPMGRAVTLHYFFSTLEQYMARQCSNAGVDAVTVRSLFAAVPVDD